MNINDLMNIEPIITEGSEILDLNAMNTDNPDVTNRDYYILKMLRKLSHTAFVIKIMNSNIERLEKDIEAVRQLKVKRLTDDIEFHDQLEKRFKEFFKGMMSKFPDTFSDRLDGAMDALHFMFKVPYDVLEEWENDCYPEAPMVERNENESPEEYQERVGVDTDRDGFQPKYVSEIMNKNEVPAKEQSEGGLSNID